MSSTSGLRGASNSKGRHSRGRSPRPRRHPRLDFEDNPQAAARLVRRILARIDRFAASGLPHAGRPGLREGTRELVEAPYIIVYIVDEPADEITVLAIFHNARNREDS